jgi:hypothetical protein
LLYKNSTISSIGYCVLFIGLAFAFAMNLDRAKDLGIFENLPQWAVVRSVPVALTNIKNSTHPRYTVSTTIRDAFFVAPMQPPDSTEEINAAITKISHPDFEKDLGDFVILDNDDKGTVDFVEFAFRIFGLKIQSVAIAYYSLLFVSCFLFGWRYWREPLALVAVTCLLLAEFQLLPYMTFNKQLVSPLATRCLPIFALVSCLHCALYYWKKNISWGDILAVIMQCLVILIVYHMRMTTMWQFLVLLAMGAVIVARYLYSRLIERSIWTFKQLVIKIIPTICVLASLAGLNVYRGLVFPKEYTQSQQVKTRVFWHNIYSGFALHPKIAKEHSLRIDDMSIITDALNFLEDRQDYERWKLIGGGTNFKDIKWALYDLVVKEMLFDVCTKHKKYCLETYLLYKPMYFFETLTWFYGLKNYPSVADVFVSTYFGDIVKQQILDASTEVEKRKMNAAPWGNGFIWILLIMTLGVLLTRVRAQELSKGKIALTLAWIGLVSMFPSMIGYPSPLSMVDSVVAFNCAIQFGLVVMLVHILIVMREYYNGSA